ncbi:hypothetical protein [Georgenia sp. AZ-5]|uniref:hypothetical protein n=1 Tax=Georgenia sp. AZ-5 TaxID=3367526 RepID=UPI0037541373
MLHDLHAPVTDRVAALVRRGRADGTFLRDVPEAWLVTTYFALVHAGGGAVGAGAMDPDAAAAALTTTLRGAFRTEGIDQWTPGWTSPIGRTPAPPAL